jgi:CheY-like chemotaxis protein
MLKHFRILVVEDHNDSREMLEEFLTEEGFTVETAINGLQALERMRRGPRLDLVLLDLMMPVMTGWDLMDRVAQEPSLWGVPVIVVSGAGATRPIPRNVLTSIPKPLDLNLLMETISRLQMESQGAAVAASR